MAKSAAPFLSINPSGSIAGLLTASRWKGRPYLRLLVTPSNPQTGNQGNVRYALATIAKAARAVLTSFIDVSHVGSPFFQMARDMAPSGQSWISWMQQVLFSPVGDEIPTAWAALGGTKQGYFASTAGGVGLTNFTPSFPVGENNIVSLAGAQLFALAYFASIYLTGTVKDAADLAIAGANQGDVDDFGDIVHLTV